MGCFNVSCAVSHITIKANERVFLFPLLPMVSEYEIEHGYESDGTVQLEPSSMILHQDEYYIPFCFPIEGYYDEYGSIERIRENENTHAIEKFLGISIKEFVSLITENIGKRSYNTSDTFYDVFFTKKELMKNDVSFDDFLIGLGFLKKDNFYLSPKTELEKIQYRIEKNVINEEDVYSVSIDDENFNSNIDEDFCLNNIYNRKQTLLKIHHHLTGSYLGIENMKAFTITQKMSAMFVHGEIYDFLSRRKDTLKKHPKEVEISKHFLKSVGFRAIDLNKYEETYKKEGISVKLKYGAEIKKENVSYDAYNCYDFIKIYKKLTGTVLDIPDDLDLDSTEFLFEDMVNNYISTKKKYNDTGKEIYKYLLIRQKGLGLFKDWRYFIDLYNELIENRTIKPFYISYMRFFERSYSVNMMYFPTFQGEQGGNDKEEKELIKKTLEIINKRMKKQM